VSQREHQILIGISRGLSNAAIGAELYVAEDTVKTHARRLYRKLGVADRGAAVAAGFRRHLLQ
jgi:ATP/maltotriose-dependent transcriptional regulator MalT